MRFPFDKLGGEDREGIALLRVTVEDNRVRIGERFSVSFQRTLRIPDDGRVYPLPPGLGAFPIHRVEEYRDRVPVRWRQRGGVFIPMYQREALWLGFSGAPWKPNAVKITVGKINALSGEVWDEKLHADPQDYIVCPDQPWLDGFNIGQGVIRQFVAVPLGMGYTVEGQVTGAEEVGGIQILVYEPRPGRFPDPPPEEGDKGQPMRSWPTGPARTEMGLGAGGRIKQKIYPDPYGIDTWNPEVFGSVFVHIVNSEDYREITDLELPPTPIDVRTYIKHELPWFDLYDESRGDISASERLTKLKTIREKDADRGIPPGEDDDSAEVPESHIQGLHHGRPSGDERAR